MFLFKVQECFSITDVGLILTPDNDYRRVKVGDALKIIKPDRTIIETVVKGIAFNQKFDLLIGNNLKKEDIPVGSEIWLNGD